MCRFTGHPLVDVGIAALTAFAGHTQPQALTADDLARAAAWLDEHYVSGTPLGGLVQGVLLLNSGYFNSKRAVYVQQVLYSWRPDAPRLDVPCSFCGQPAAYRANREHIPLLNGREVVNFSPAGRAGLPVCGVCSLAFHMLPAGCFKSGAGLVAVHSENTAVTLAFAGQNLLSLQRALTLNTEAEKLPGLPVHTHLAELLTGWLMRQERQQSAPAPLTAYFFSNSGTKPFINIYRVDTCTLRFLEEVLHPADLAVRAAWDDVVARAWDDAGGGQNAVYRSLLTLPENALGFLRRFLLPTYCWALVEVYLRKVMNVQDSDIERLREVGTRLANYARYKNRFFYDFSRTGDYSRWRKVVLGAADDAARVDGQPLLSFDEFVALFTYRDGEYWNWRLARDLVTLLMIEARAVTPDDEALFGDEVFTESE